MLTENQKSSECMTASSGNIVAPFQVRISMPAMRMPTVAEAGPPRVRAT